MGNTWKSGIDLSHAEHTSQGLQSEIEAEHRKKDLQFSLNWFYLFNIPKEYYFQ